METIKNKTAEGKRAATNATTHAVPRGRMLAIFFTVCCFAAPILMGLASFDMGELKTFGEFGGVSGMYGITFWIGGLLGMSWLLWPRAPRLALIAACLGTIGCVGGSNFILAGMFRRALMTAGVQGEQLWFTSGSIGLGGLLVSVAMGAWFPLSLIIFGIGLMRFKVIPVWLGVLLCVAGVCFPLGRIPGDPVFIHTADVLLLAAMSVLGWRYMRVVK